MEKGKSPVILAALNAKYIHSSLSVWYLAAGILKYAKELSPFVVEATIHEEAEKLANNILAHGAFAVCFSCYIWNIEKTLETAAHIKAVSPDTAVILGGPEAEHNAERLLREYSFITAVSLGEGEESLPEVLKVLSIKKALRHHDESFSIFSTLSGIAYLYEGCFYCNKPQPLKNEPPSPYTPEYLSALEGRMAYIETSRGCPYSCAFCLSGVSCAPKWFLFERAKADIVMLAKSGAQTIKFIDRTFNAKASHANAIWQFIAENYGKEIPEGTRFHFEIAADILTPESMRLLQALPRGAVQLEAGIQSVNEQVLAAVRRKTDTSRLLCSLHQLIGFDNMHVHIDLIAGLPHEGLQSFINGFNRVYALKANMLQLGFLKLLHGSAMRSEPQSYPCEFDKKPPYEVFSTPWLSKEDIELLKAVEDGVDRLYNSQRFLLTLDYVIEKSGLSAFVVFAAIPRAEHKTSLADYTKQVFESLATLPNIEKPALRDVMAQDWLSFNSTGRLPPALCIADTMLKQAVKALAKNKAFAPKPEVKRGTAILYSESSVVYADYDFCDEITKRYRLNKIPLDILFNDL